MRVMCINGQKGILEEGEVYTVIYVTTKGNYLLAEVEVPKPYTSFDASRFIPLEDDPVEDWFVNFLSEGENVWPPDQTI